MTTQELITHTKLLMAIPSMASNPRALKQAVGYVEKIVAQCPNVTIERFEQNGKPSFLAYRGPVRPDKFDILLNGHVDVVPAKASMFKPVVKDGRLYGRGALDMKGTTLTLADVFCEVVNEVPYALGLQIVSDEEIGGHDCAKYQISEGVKAGLVLVGEYSNERNVIYNAARGLCWVELAFSGKSAHGGHLWHGANAVVKAGDFAAAVLRRYPTPDKETWTTTASIANLRTPNDTYNKVPDTAYLKIDFRFTQEDPVFQNRQTLETFLATIDPEARIVNLVNFEPAVGVDELNPYVQSLSKALQKVTGQKPRFEGRPAGSDGRHFALTNSDVVEFGLYGKGSHSDGEYVELAAFKEYRATMRDFLRNPLVAQKRGSKTHEPLQEQLLRKLVSMPTTSDNVVANNAAMDYIEDFLTERSMYVERFEKNGRRSLIATTRPGNKEPTVLLNAHTDVVPGPANMFKLSLKGDKFTGRGVMDMKHAIAAYLTVVDALKDELQHYDFGLMITSDEEIGSNDGVKPLVFDEDYRAKVVIVPDGGNNWDIETYAKGVYWLKLEASGKVAHASRPWEGESAIKRLLAAIKEIEALVPVDPKPTDTLMSVGTIEGGVVANQIPASASAMLDIRTGSVADHERLPKQIEAICEAHGVTGSYTASEGPCVTDPKHPMVKPMIDIAESVTGAKHGTTYDYAVTDGRIFSAVGIPTIVINPECGDIHSNQEWLSRKSFAQFCTALELYVRKVAPSQDQNLPSRDVDQALLAKRLNTDSDKSVRIWYATYGTGLSKFNFMKHINGGRIENAERILAGCTDQTPPAKDAFMSIPYARYFAGNCYVWKGGGHINIEPLPSSSAQTISHVYLITLDQFEEIVAQQNDRTARQSLPLREAMKRGHATIGDGSGHYDELVFCGVRDNIPIFSITAVRPELPYKPPTELYTRLLLRGLSENAAISEREAVNYVVATPGIKGSVREEDVFKLAKDLKKNRK